MGSSGALVLSSVLGPVALLLASACSSSSSNHPVEMDSGVAPEGGDAAAEEAGPSEAAACTLSSSLTLVGPQSPKLSAACTTCVTALCCKQANACEATQDCAALDACIAACPTLESACALGCEAAHPTGLTAGTPFVDCELAVCNVPCQNFACAGAVTWPAPKTQTATFTFVPYDLEANKPIANATVKVCASTDAACANPSNTYTTNAMGHATVTAPTSAAGIDGYLEITASGEETTLAYVGLVNGSADLPATGATIRAPVLSTSAFTAGTKAAGITPDATRGHVTFLAEDCTGFAAQGVKAAASNADSKTVTAYLVLGVPSLKATATDPEGEGAIVNIPAGTATITGTDQAGSKYSSQSVIIRAGAITGMTLVATPGA